MELTDGQSLEAELMLVAVGRGPQTSDLGYQEAGVELDDGFVRVNERLLTSLPGVYAVGDLVRGLSAGAPRLRTWDLCRRGDGPPGRRTRAGFDADNRMQDVPRVTYCDPEIASVGLSEDEARARLATQRRSPTTWPEMASHRY